MLPRYASMEQIMNRLMSDYWKEELEEKILKICDENDCIYINYKNCKEIYKNANFLWMQVI